MRRLSLALCLTAFAAFAEDVPWMWDETGRVVPEDPAIYTAACSTTFDSRLFAIGYADPVADGLLRFDSRLFMREGSEGIDFDSTKLGLLICL